MFQYGISHLSAQVSMGDTPQFYFVPSQESCKERPECHRRGWPLLVNGSKYYTFRRSARLLFPVFFRRQIKRTVCRAADGC